MSMGSNPREYIMKAKRIGNGKGIEAIETVKRLSDEAAKLMMDYGSGNDNNKELATRLIVSAGIANDAINKLFADVASGVIDDGDIMDFMIEHKNPSFMRDIDDLSILFSEVVVAGIGII